MFNYETIKSLNELELLLYKYIMRNSEKVIYMRIRELANEAHVSTTTILNFCKKLNCRGYSEFKLKLKLYLEEEKDSVEDSDISMIIDYFKKIEKSDLNDQIKKVVEYINNSKNVIFLGFGLSGKLCEHASRYLSALGKINVCISDPFFPLSCNYYDNSVTIVFSVSGETPEVVELVNKLKKEKSIIISITNSEKSTIAKMSDLNIAYYVQKEIVNKHNITTQLPVLYIIESIGKQFHKSYSMKIKEE